MRHAGHLGGSCAARRATLQSVCIGRTQCGHRQGSSAGSMSTRHIRQRSVCSLPGCPTCSAVAVRMR
eukprot:6993755-Lingulodinium_polyedra.AAC.1